MHSLLTLLYYRLVMLGKLLAMVFICGIINIIITFTSIRKAIILGIPESLQHAIGGGIGIFIAYIGIKNAGIFAFLSLTQELM